MLRNIKLLIEYDGTDFSGWQRQPHKRTVQATIEEVLRKITQEKVHLIGASRTDAGVHALGQVASFVVPTKSGRPHRAAPTCEKILVALNGLLPRDVAVKEVREVPPSFHANKDAKKKTYRYLIWNAKVRSALLRERAWHVWKPLNLQAIRKGAKPLVGRHDFSAFRGTRSGTKTAVREIYKIAIRRGGVTPPLHTIEITATGFLKHMVRNIVGTLVAVGEGRLRPDDVKKILGSRDRKKAGVTAPACGLYLVSIDY